jgi:hypothetical protein
LSTDQRDENQKPPFHVEGGIPVFDRLNEVEREQAESKKRDKEYKDEQLSLDRRMVHFTGLLVLCTAIVGGINGWQAHIANRSAKAADSAAKTAADTLREIRASATDTHELAVQAKNQADRTGEIASQALAQAQSTRDLAGAAGRTARIAEESLKASEKSFAIDQRPYLWIANIPKALNFDSVPTIGHSIDINVYFTNYGKSPAIIKHAFYATEFGKDAVSKVRPMQWMDDRLGREVVPNGKISMFRSRSKRAVPDRQALAEMVSTDSYVVMFAVIQYSDIAGHLYESDFCTMVNKVGEFENCEGNHNDFKDCEKDPCVKQ